MDGVVSEFPIPPPVGDPVFITHGPDGALWFTQTYDNVIRRITTTGSFSTFSVPTPDGRPSRIITGPDGNLWFGEYEGKIGRLTPSGVFTEFSLPTSNPGITGLAVGADGAIWFNEANVAQIGRITTGACESGANTLCLNNRRFEVTAFWSVPSQETSGAATAVALTPDTGYFWFFTPNNVELTVKVVDGRAFNNRFWLFGGALSNVEYTITVRDTVSGQVKSYSNPQGTLASFADTNAF
jgi:streptogramin lyase